MKANSYTSYLRYKALRYLHYNQSYHNLSMDLLLLMTNEFDGYCAVTSLIIELEQKLKCFGMVESMALQNKHQN